MDGDVFSAWTLCGNKIHESSPLRVDAASKVSLKKGQLIEKLKK